MKQVLKIVGQSGSKPRSEPIFAVLGETIRTNPKPIAQHCLKILAPVSEDLATIVEGVALADRMKTRLLTEGWSRHLELDIPVFELGVFNRGEIQTALCDALGFLTGDDWNINFTQRTDKPMAERYLRLSQKPVSHVVPFSEGLDSFAQVALLEDEFGSDAILPLQAGKLQAGREGRQLLQIPRRFHAGHPREKTYRTRPFVYFTLAGIGCATADAKSVVIGENGQGSLGPSFARFYNEWPFRSTHPGFVARLQRFLSLAFDRAIEFRQPHLWLTKGEVVTLLRDKNLLRGIDQTRSCSLRPYQRRERDACGFCGGCLLRQNAFVAAGLPTQTDLAFDPGSAELRLRSRSGRFEDFTHNEREILARAASSMAIFAEMAVSNDTSSRVALEAKEIPGMPFEEADVSLRSLFHRHRSEWRTFLGALPSNAWLRREFGDQ
ncbi:hypothetical protein GVN24_34470 [Rhizobium sp. CRIBSB]|nr:hypothetical protein [Rhizobium sp. CRIBSB]